MVSMEGELERTSRELESAVTENSALLERVGEMATASVTLAETSAELERVRGELAAEVKGRREVGEERDKLLEVLRRHEVETHTVGVAPESPAPREEGDREKEEEIGRLNEYIGKLLSAVVNKAPFVLERIE